MTSEEFQNLSLQQLAVASGIDKYRWSRYIRGKKAPNERTLNRAAKNLKMPTPSLLEAIQYRREHPRIVSRLK